MNTVNIKTVCPLCEKETIITVDKEKFEKYQNGALIQNCFPELSPEVREQLISGICPDCWNTFVCEEDEESYENLPNE